MHTVLVVQVMMLHAAIEYIIFFMCQHVILKGRCIDGAAKIFPAVQNKGLNPK